LSAARKSVRRITRLIVAALTEESKEIPGKVDSVSRLAYLLGLDRSIKIIMEEIKKEEHETVGKIDLNDEALEQ
jgi:hypothetical protein